MYTPSHFPGTFQGWELRQDAEGWICARDLGRALDYDADGGNLSRNFNHVTIWREQFAEGEDWRRDARGRIWLSPAGVLNVLRLVMAWEREDRAAHADALLRRWYWNSARRIAA